MSLALHKENYFWHKVHSLTGIIPVGFYMIQHLTLNSFTLESEAKFNGVVNFFEGLPKHVLLGAEALLIWLPLLFHAIYGLFIINRAKPNYIGTKYGWSQNRMFTLQRWTGLLIFLFLLYHVLSTTVYKYVTNDVRVIEYAAWQEKLSANGYILTFVYLIGVLASSYHLAYGVWNFCIRWGITISDKAQARVQKFAFWMFILVTLLGWSALWGFFRHQPAGAEGHQPSEGSVYTRSMSA